MRPIATIVVTMAVLGSSCGGDGDQSRDRQPDSELEALLASWDLSRELHRLNEPARSEDIRLTESELGRSLPRSLRTIYERSDGGEYLEGNLMVEPVRSSETSEGLNRLTSVL